MNHEHEQSGQPEGEPAEAGFFIRPYAYDYGGQPAAEQMILPELEWTRDAPGRMLGDLPAEAMHPQATVNGEGSERPLRILHVGPCLMRGGAEFWLAALARFLDPRRARIVRCMVTIPDQVDPEVAAELGGIPIEAATAETIRGALGEADVLLSWGTPQLGRWLTDCRPRLSVFVAHGEGPWTRDVYAACRPVIDHVVAVSQRVRSKVCHDLPCTTILNGIDSSRLAVTGSRRHVREMLGFGPDDFVLGFVGRFAHEKRVHVIIDALARLPRRFKALLVGSGPLRSALIESANARIPGRYAFVKATRFLGDYYQAMDASCLISHEEGFALVMLEAMMCGRPLIATPVGAVPEVVVDRVNGLIIPGTPRSLAEAAVLLDQHPEWARGLAAEGRNFALEHGHARRMAERYSDLLERLWHETRHAMPAGACSIANSSGHGNGRLGHPTPSANGLSASAGDRASSRPRSRES